METINTEVKHFLSGLESVLHNAEKFQKENSLEYAFQFNPLIHFYEVHENRLSDIIAFFLNPEESHGQGTLFLDLFLSSEFGCKDRVGNFKKVRIHREKLTTGLRRLDLLLDFDGSYGIGIENKIWAGDQYMQISDYNKWLKYKYGNNYTLIYLTPYGKTPSEESIMKSEFESLVEDKKIIVLNYSFDIINLLQIWTEKCRAEKVRQFLKDFQQLINHNINGNIFMTEQNTITNYILEVDGRLKTAIGIFESMNNTYDELIKLLKNQLKEIAQKRDLLLEFDLDRYDRYTGFSFLFSNDKQRSFNIRFEWDRNYIREGYYGFTYPKGKKNIQLEEIFSKSLGIYNHSEDWPWYKSLDKYHNFDNRTYLDLQNGEFSIYVENKLVELLDSSIDIK